MLPFEVCLDQLLRELEQKSELSPEDEQRYWRALVRAGKVPPFPLPSKESLQEDYQIVRSSEAGETCFLSSERCQHQNHFFHWHQKKDTNIRCQHKHKDKQLLWNCLFRHIKAAKMEEFKKQMVSK